MRGRVVGLLQRLPPSTLAAVRETPRVTGAGLLLLVVLSGKPAKAPKAPPKSSPLVALEAAVAKASPACREALVEPLTSLGKAVAAAAASPEHRDRAQQQLTDVFGRADGAGCSDDVRRELAALRQRLAGGGDAAPGPVETDRFDLALRTLEMAQRSMETPECEAAVGKHVARWLERLHAKRADRAMALEMRAKAKAVSKVCDTEFTQRLDAAAVNLLPASR